MDKDQLEAETRGIRADITQPFNVRISKQRPQTGNMANLACYGRISRGEASGRSDCS